MQPSPPLLWPASCTDGTPHRRTHVRHSLNIIVAIISMAAGAWHGTTAQTGQPGPTRRAVRANADALTLRGCVQKGSVPGQFVLLAPAPGTTPESASAAPPR